MKEKAEKLNWGKQKSYEMFVLGINHDIGYKFGNNSNYNIIVGRILKEM